MGHGSVDTGNGPITDHCIYQLFEAQARQMPGALAVIFRDQRLTYAELDFRANQLAQYLFKRGVQPETLVGICLERGIGAVVAILGVLKAGAAYLPLDPDYPPQRLSFMVADAKVSVLLTQRSLLPHFRTDDRQDIGDFVCLDEDWPAISLEPPEAPDNRATDNNLAYVIFTSGSTGVPKGVLIERHGLCNMASAQLQVFGLKPGDRVLHFSSLSFDASVFEIFMAFRAGATLVIAPPEARVPGPALLKLLRDERVTIVTLPPSVLAALPVEELENLRFVSVAGEACSAELVERWAPGRRFFNLYGPTEATVWATLSECVAGGSKPSIGKAIPNTRVHLLDAEGLPTRPGEPGELYIEGAGLARGYLNRPELNAQKFVMRSLSTEPETRWYKTGDVGRLLPDGNIDFIGRQDDQVKLRGFRIELGEIEAVLRSHPGVRDAVVALKQNAGGEQKLVGYFVPRNDAMAWREAACGGGEGAGTLAVSRQGSILRGYLEEKLPHYMVPAALVPMEFLPLSIQGKVDRAALPEPAEDRSLLSGDYVAPRNGFEARLAAIWARVLKVDHVGVLDNFFELGGDSLTGAVLINALQNDLGIQLYIVALFDSPTVAEQAVYLRKHFPEATGEGTVIPAQSKAKHSHGSHAEQDVYPRITATDIERFRGLAAAWHRGDERPQRWKQPRNPRMAFILAPPRSGSSLLRIMLAGHPHLFAPPELEMLSFDTLQQRRDRLGGRVGFMKEGLIRALMEAKQCGAEQAKRIVEAHETRGDSVQSFYRLLQDWIGDRLLVDKSTTYALSSEVLQRAEEGFEDNVYIHLVRHPYGMMRSFEEARLDRVLTFDDTRDYPVRQFAELVWILSHQNILGFLSGVPAHRQLRVHFEDMVREPRPVIERICGMLGVDFDPLMVEPYQQQAHRMTDGLTAQSAGMSDPKFHSHKKIDPGIADRWRGFYKEDFLSGHAWQLAEELGYPRTFSNPEPAAQPGVVMPIALTARDPLNPPPQSYAQQRLWFLDRLAPGNPGYNTSRVIDLAGALNVTALERSLAEIFRRHEVCRTGYVLKEGKPVQLIRAHHSYTLPFMDLSALEPAKQQAELDRIARDEIMTRFDLAHDPLCRALLLRLDERRHVLILVIHHILTDAWSRGVIHRELSALYRSFLNDEPSPLLPLPFQYADFAVWQRQVMEGAEGRALQAYWLEQMRDPPAVLKLPVARPRPAKQTHEGACKIFRLPGHLVAGLSEIGRQEQATLFMVLMTAFNTLLGRYSGQTDLVVGIPVSGRNRAEFEQMIGLFLNVLPVRTRLAEGVTFRALLGQIRDTTLGAFSHQDYPFDLIVSGLKLDRGADYHPLFQVMFALHQPLLQDLDLPGLQCAQMNIGPRPMPYDMTVTAVDEPDGLDIFIDYNIDLFDAPTIERFAAHFHRLLECIVASPDEGIDAPSLLAEGERVRLVVEWNRTERDYPREATVPELFEAQARRTPEAVAAAYPDGTLNYGQLNRRANRLAHYLRQAGVVPGVLVGLCVERSTTALVAMLGILKAGGTYVPLDPEYPVERLSFMLQDTRAMVVVTQSGYLEKLPATTARLVCLDREEIAIAGQSDEDLDGGTNALNLAYVIYTSGSTGIPKGVQVTHRGIVRLVRNTDYIDIRPSDRFAQVSVISFDAATFEIWGALLNGGQVVGVPREIALSPREFADFLRQQRIGVMFLTTALFNQMAREAPGAFQTLRYLLVGGEAASVSSVRAVLRDGPPEHLLNAYGPTEVTTFATWHPVTGIDERADTVPIGRPIANTTAYILDERKNPVPIGITGELYLGGDGVADGYLNRPELTAERFVDDPFGQTGSRLYRTGDWVRYREDGAIEFVGRRDGQVKIRGFRIELGEIEHALRRLPQARDAVALMREDVPGDKRIVAYIVADEGQMTGDVRGELKQHLPGYMIPSVFVVMDKFPLTPNGKVDRSALPPPQPARPVEQAKILPRSELEKRIAAIFCDVLQLDTVGIRENFFDLGGHSLLLVKVHSLLGEAFGERLSIIELFEYPSVEALAGRLAATGDGEQAFHAVHRRAEKQKQRTGAYQPIAIVGMAGRYPGAEDPEALWRNICSGKEFVTVFTDDELRAEGVSDNLLGKPNYVKTGVVLDGVGLFDAAFFGYTPREAQVLDPQQRLFLECSWEALENAGQDSYRYDGLIGVFAGISQNRYANLMAKDPALAESFSDVENLISSDKDFVATRVSYKLNLKGPSITVQTACSTSLVAVHMAARSLQEFECDMALAGGVSIKLPQKTGYLYYPEGIASPDGHCRAFDADSRGAMRGNGASIVVLKRLDDALANGDNVLAVIKGSAVNNDGAGKIGYTAPSVEGQSEVIATAQAEAGVDPATIGYIEAHGTGTRLGDPVEVTALTKAFRAGTDKRQYCGIGSIKTNIGHLDAAAGCTGLIKAMLAVRDARLPPSLHFKKPNPEIDFACSPFFVVDRLQPWAAEPAPRRAGVSAFGVGGTNAHVVVEEAPLPEASGPSRAWQILPVSAKTETALATALERLNTHLSAHPEQNIADVAHTLRVGRREFDWRAAFVCRNSAEGQQLIGAQRIARARVTRHDRPVVFMFTGQGSQYPHMGQGLYQSEAIYRQVVDECCAILQRRAELDLTALLYPDEGEERMASERLRETWHAQPALFVTEYALARLWMSWGIEPEAMIGHSIGEYVAACLAGVMVLEDALVLVALRGRLIGQLESGSMFAVALSEADIRPHLGESLSLAAINAPGLCVVSGPTPDIDQLEGRLRLRGLEPVRLHTSHAFHSKMMEPILGEFTEQVARIKLAPPQRPYLSNVSGNWIEASQATDPGYWAQHLRQGVRFSAGVAQLLADESRVFLEAGPGSTLSGLVRQQLSPTAPARVFNSLRSSKEQADDQAYLLDTLTKLWLSGVEVDWKAYSATERRRRLALPTYPFERQMYWINASPRIERNDGKDKRSDIADWFYVPAWKRSVVPLPQQPRNRQSYLIFCDCAGLGKRLARSLSDRGDNVVVVGIADHFAIVEAGSAYVLNPSEPNDYKRLFEELADQRRLPDLILHLWGVGRADTYGSQYQDIGFFSLLYLVQAIGASTGPVRIDVITDNVQSVTGMEQIVPDKATMLGPCRVIPQEYAALACRNIDLAITGDDFGALADLLLMEIDSGGSEPAVAYRAGKRWVQIFEPMPLAPFTGNPALLKQGGVYLVTGGLGGIGLAVAAHLARSVQAKLVLTGRSSFPAPAEWQEWLIEHGTDDRISKKILRLQELQAAGAELLIVRADVADETQMRDMLASVRERFGPINGVIHSAGISGGGIMQLKTRASALDVLAAKVRGTRILGHLLEGNKLDFMVLCSSLASVLGGVSRVDYCAANAYLDAYATHATQFGGLPVISINWDTWRDVGMAVDADLPGQLAAQRDRVVGMGITLDEGVEVFRRSLASGPLVPQILISTKDLRNRLAMSAIPPEHPVLSDSVPPAGRGEGHARPPQLSTPYAAPRNATEETLVIIWQDMLGIEPVGIDDNFFELGGHSLLAIRVLGQMNEAFDFKLSFQNLFDAPTVSQLATKIEALRMEQSPNYEKIASLLGDIDRHSEEEIQQMLMDAGWNGVID